MKRCLPYILAALLPQAALAGGVLNILLAGAIQYLTASASPTSITYSFPSATLTSSSTTCSGHGGIPPYSYGWSWASGGASIGINSASSAITSFTVTGAAVNTTYSGVAQCAATDARPVTSPFSSGVSVSLTRIPLLPPSVGSATLTGGTDGSSYGYSGIAGDLFGSLSPSTDYNGRFVEALYCGNSGTGPLSLSIDQPSSNSSYFNTISINGVHGLLNLGSVTASYSYSSPYGTWIWSSIACPFSLGSGTPVLYY